MLAVVKVAGDGDCLFHALAFLDNYDGGALRIELAEFMERHAHTQSAFQEEWLIEASKLRCNRWAGHTVITAYSLMKNTRVMVHTKEGGEGTVKVEEMSHASVFGSREARLVHILYNGSHYDALVEISNMEGMRPAWPQPPPPRYFTQRGPEEFPALADSAQAPAPTRGQKRGLTAPRPAKKAKAKAKAKAAKGAKAAKAEPAAGEAAPESAETPLGDAPAPPVPLEENDEGDPMAPGLLEELQNIPVASGSQHPHRKVEDLIQDAAVSEGQGKTLRCLLHLQQQDIRMSLTLWVCFCIFNYV